MNVVRATVLGCALVLWPAAAAAQGGREMIVGQMENAVSLYEARGFRPDPGALPRDAVIGLLGEESVVYLEVQLEGGVDYMIEGFCDGDCDDLDLVLLSKDAESVATDVETNDVPELHFTTTEAGRYYLGVKMVTCATELCFFGYRILRK